MELALICPVVHLEYTSLLPGRFCIAPVAKKSEVYRSYFAQASVDGYDVTLDNGVFESDRVSFDEYIELVKYIKPKVLVIPDTINVAAHTNWSDALDFIDSLDASKVQDTLPRPLELMYVVQCAKGQTTGFWEALQNAHKHEKVQ